MEKCKGEGLGSCRGCAEKGIWNRTWMVFLYKVEGYDGLYCYECAKELERKNNDKGTR